MSKVLSYRPDIDGLRAIAILSVIAFHASSALLPGGFIGVDIFFIISGYLISSIIIRELALGRFTFTSFYIRRIRRIFPSLIVVLLFVAAYGWLVLLPDELSALGKHITAGAFFVSNIVLWKEAGYFDAIAAFKPLLHLWSLGIEEQFYIIWPLLVVLCWRLRFRLFFLLLIGLAVSFTLNIWYVKTDPTAVFYLPVTRFWELLLGSFLAWYQNHKNNYIHLVFSTYIFKRPVSSAQEKIINNTQAMLGTALLIFALVHLTEAKAFPGWWALLPTFGTLLLISASHKAWINKHILSHPWLVYIGLISFPLYLWHWPLLAFARIIKAEEPPTRIKIIAVLLAFILAWLSYQFIEHPIRKLRPGKKKRLVITSIILLNIALGGLGYVLYKQYISAHFQMTSLKKFYGATTEWIYPTVTSYDQKLVVHNLPGSGTKTVIFIGDSHTEHYWLRLLKLSQTQAASIKNITFATHGGCIPVPGININTFENYNCHKFINAAIQAAEKPNVDTVVFSAFWDGPYFWGLYHLTDPKIKDNIIKYDNPNALIVLQNFETMIKKLRQDNKKVYIILSTPADYNFDPKRMIRRNFMGKFELRLRDVSRQEFVARANIIIAKLRAIAQRTGAIVIDPVPYLCNATICPILGPDGIPRYIDQHHLRGTFVRDNVTFLDPIVKR